MKVQYVMNFIRFYESCTVCMIFVRLIQTVVEMYVGGVGWSAPASVSTDWSPLSVDGCRSKFAGQDWRFP